MLNRKMLINTITTVLIIAAAISAVLITITEVFGTIILPLSVGWPIIMVFGVWMWYVSEWQPDCNWFASENDKNDDE